MGRNAQFRPRTESHTFPLPLDGRRSVLDRSAPILIHPGSDAYDGARRAWNLRSDQRPACVCVARSVEDVQAAVAYAREHALTVAAQSTGHLAQALPSLERTLLLKLALHDGEVVVDPVAQTALIKAGARWGDVVAAVTPHGVAVTQAPPRPSVSSDTCSAVDCRSTAGRHAMMDVDLSRLRTDAERLFVSCVDGRDLGLGADGHPMLGLPTAGRHPNEICILPMDCLEYDTQIDENSTSQKLAVLVHDMPKVARTGCRLPIDHATGELIAAQKAVVRARYSDTPLRELRLFPRMYRNPHGTIPMNPAQISRVTRLSVNALPVLLDRDGGPFPRGRVAPARGPAVSCSSARDFSARIYSGSASGYEGRPSFAPAK